MLEQLLESTPPETKENPWLTYVIFGVIILAIIALLVWSFLSNKKRKKEFENTISAIKPGSKVKTIGGIIGEVVEVNEEEGTFVLKTGDEFGNCSFMKFDKQAIYQTDAKPEPAPEAPAPQPEEEAAPAEPFEEGENAQKDAAPSEEDAAEKEDK